MNENVLDKLKCLNYERDFVQAQVGSWPGGERDVNWDGRVETDDLKGEKGGRIDG